MGKRDKALVGDSRPTQPLGSGSRQTCPSKVSAFHKLLKNTNIY